MAVLFKYFSIITVLQTKVFGCNGSPKWCHLGFDQYTFLGSHNSAAYNLKLECNNNTDNLVNKLTCESLKGFPAINDCLYNNQAGFSIKDQLEAGVRAFDLDLCPSSTKGRVKTCHGWKDFFAYGDFLDTSLSLFKSFLQDNPQEVVVLEFGDLNGPIDELTSDLVSSVEGVLDGYLYSPTSSLQHWPTLGEMIETGNRVVVFTNPVVFNRGKAPPGWLLNRDSYYQGAWEFTHQFQDPSKVSTAIKNYCEEREGSGKWLGCDFEFSLNADYLEKAILNQKNSCIADIAAIINPSVSDTVHDCLDKRVIHRIRTDNLLTNIKELVRLVNQVNTRELIIFPSLSFSQ